jgi:hypothetical protein
MSVAFRFLATTAAAGVISILIWTGEARAAQAGTQITVTGCIEKDAAASTPIFKLIGPPPNSKVYRLSAPREIDLGSHVGHTVEVTGVASDVQGSRQSELTVSKLTMVHDTCASASYSETRQ